VEYKYEQINHFFNNLPINKCKVHLENGFFQQSMKERLIIADPGFNESLLSAECWKTEYLR